MPTYYYADDTIDSPEAGKKRHEEYFTKDLNEYLKSLGHNSSVMTSEKYQQVLSILTLYSASGSNMNAFESNFDRSDTNISLSTAKNWIDNYDLLQVGGEDTLVYSGHKGDSLEDLQIVSHTDRMFQDLYKLHVTDGNDHPKGKTLENKVKMKFGKSINREIAKLFTKTCPRCLQHLQKKKPVAGNFPIITRGMGVRTQIDLIDFQSCPDGEFRFLLSFIDHGVKELSDDFMDQVISEIKNLWPACQVVRGSPRYSQSNGGVERLNYEVEKKLAAWMKDNDSKCWSIGCKIVQWQVNTSIHRSIGNKIPYELTFGQKPRVGMSSLKLSEELLRTLRTEEELNHALQITDGTIENATIDLNTTNTTTTSIATPANSVPTTSNMITDMNSNNNTTTSIVDIPPNSETTNNMIMDTNSNNTTTAGIVDIPVNSVTTNNMLMDMNSNNNTPASIVDITKSTIQWLQLVERHSNISGLDLKSAVIRETFACMYNSSDDMNNPFEKCILRKCTNHEWEVLDATGINLLNTVSSSCCCCCRYCYYYYHDY